MFLTMKMTKTLDLYMFFPSLKSTMSNFLLVQKQNMGGFGFFDKAKINVNLFIICSFYSFGFQKYFLTALLKYSRT